MAFRVGQIVVCINARRSHPGRQWTADKPIEGQIYTITGIGLISPIDGLPVIQLAEIRNDEERGYVGYRASRFRPVVSTDTGMAVLEQIRRDVSNKILRPIFEDEQV